MAAKRDAAERTRGGSTPNRRYRPVQWNDVRDWRTLVMSGERWFGLERVSQLNGLPPEISMIGALYRGSIHA